MKFPVRLLAVSALLAPLAHGAEEDFHFKAIVHMPGAAAIPVDILLAPSSVRTVELANGLALEFTSPGSKGEGMQSMVRLLRREGEAFTLIHTTRQTLIEGVPRENSYLYCNEGVIFMSPPREPLPECRT